MNLPSCSHRGMRRDLPRESFWRCWRARWPARGGGCHWEWGNLPPEPACAGFWQQCAGFQRQEQEWGEKNVHAHSQIPCLYSQPFHTNMGREFPNKSVERAYLLSGKAVVCPHFIPWCVWWALHHMLKGSGRVGYPVLHTKVSPVLDTCAGPKLENTGIWEIIDIDSASVGKWLE